MDGAYAARNITYVIIVLVLVLFVTTLVLRKKHRWAKRALFFVAIPLLVLITAYLAYTRPNPFFDINAPTKKVVTHNVVDINDINVITPYRSSAGHTHPGNGETCRTMKTYVNTLVGDVSFSPTHELMYGAKSVESVKNIRVNSPFDGKVVGISERDTTYAEVKIQASSDPFVSVRLMHVNPIEGIKRGSKVKGGEHVGYPAQALDLNKVGGFDIALSAGGDFFPFGDTDYGWVFPYFEAMTDEAFKPWADRGYTREDFMITKEYRDAHPLECNGQEYVNLSEEERSISRKEINPYSATEFAPSP